MDTLKAFIENNAILDDGDIVSIVTLGLLFFAVFDFMHLLFSAVLSWFKRY